MFSCTLLYSFVFGRNMIACCLRLWVEAVCLGILFAFLSVVDMSKDIIICIFAVFFC